MRHGGLRKISEVVQSLCERAPLSETEEWDNVGLLVGDPSEQTSGAVISTDLTFEAIEVAIQKGYRLIINHHPCIFPKKRGISQVIAGTPVYEAIKKGIAVAAFHTNFDRCALEVVDAISQGLGFEPKGRLLENPSESMIGVAKGIGYGLWGEFSSAKSFPEFANGVKDLFNIHGFWITSPVPLLVSRVGFVAGKGTSFVSRFFVRM